MEEFGSTSDSKDHGEVVPKSEAADPEKGPGGKLILEEEREVGAVSWHVYYSYAKSMGSMWWAVVFGSFLVFTQAAQVFNSLFLGFWTGKEIKGWSNGDYMAMYAGELDHFGVRLS